MSRQLGVCWIFLWILAADVSAQYYLSIENVTWPKAKERGNIATPTIEVNNTTLFFNISSNVGLNENEEAWVGYYQKETAFAYIGCGLIISLNTNTLLPHSRNTPGLCYSLCDKSERKFIALNKDKCFCLSEIPSKNITLAECDISSNGTWMAGGGDDYMSIYEKMNTDIHVTGGNSNGGKCFVFQNTDKRRLWDGCNRYYHGICKSNGSIVFRDLNYFKWKEYVQTCFKHNSHPITYSDTVHLNINAASQSWTNVIHSDVIYMFDDASNSISQKPVMEYGYVTKNGSLLLLSFTEKNNKKRYLLQTPSVPKPTSDQLLTSTHSKMSGTTNWNNTIRNNATTRTFTASQGSNVSIPVSITVVVIILVAVVVIITLKRRGKIKGICNKNTNTENSTKGIVITDKISAENNVYNESAISDYEQISELKDNNNVDIKADLDEGNGNYGHTYFVLEPGSRESHTDGDMSDSMKEETEMNDDYNTLHLNKTFGAKADDTYDTTEKAAIKLKALQNTGCEKEFPGKLNENEEDTYNHINRSLLKNNKTDNIYGVTDNQENDYGDVNKGCKKNLHDGDDTYSHFNTTH